MGELPNYPADYGAARTRFRELATEKGWEFYALPVDEASDLFIDIALWRGSSKKLVIHSSGVHGVEAFPGSAVQCTFLDTWIAASNLPSIALIHCVNPFGMYHLRRWNAQNIDLNRNFLASFDILPTNPLYNQVSSFLNPSASGQLVFFKLRALKLIIKYSFSQLQQAIAQGQYYDPRGLFFGGEQQATETGLLCSFFRQHLSEYQIIRGIDFHTGLGGFGQSSFYLESASEEQKQQAESLLDQSVILAQDGKDQSYQTQGSLVAYLEQFYASHDFLMLTQEIGTLGPVKILQSLREENYYYQHQSDRRQASSIRLRDAFSPKDDQWKKKAVQAGLESLRQLINDLFGSG
ncbi:MAG: DUF2817 domain-containing protein [Bacteroidota bacterium]